MTWQEIAGWCIEILVGRFCLEVDSNQLKRPVEKKDAVSKVRRRFVESRKKLWTIGQIGK